MTPTSERLSYMTETKYYRNILGVSYETGRRLRELGVIIPNAVCDDQRPLFLLTPQAIETTKARINQYRAQIARSRYNLPVSTLCEKMPTVIP